MCILRIWIRGVCIRVYPQNTRPLRISYVFCWCIQTRMCILRIEIGRTQIHRNTQTSRIKFVSDLGLKVRIHLHVVCVFCVFCCFFVNNSFITYNLVSNGRRRCCARGIRISTATFIKIEIHQGVADRSYNYEVPEDLEVLDAIDGLDPSAPATIEKPAHYPQ